MLRYQEHKCLHKIGVVDFEFYFFYHPKICKLLNVRLLFFFFENLVGRSIGHDLDSSFAHIKKEKKTEPRIQNIYILQTKRKGKGKYSLTSIIQTPMVILVAGQG